jgi:hypothetical protein
VFSNLAVLASIAHAQQGSLTPKNNSGAETDFRSWWVGDGRVGDGELFEFISCVTVTSYGDVMS